MAPLKAARARHQELTRAKDYPYERPNTSFLFIDGVVYTFANCDWRGTAHLDSLQLVNETGARISACEAGRRHGVDLTSLQSSAENAFTPILAIGSNAGPVQLSRKFPKKFFPDGVVVPVVQCVLHDFDVVYTPYICSYGSCTATLEHSPGTSIGIFVTYLTPQLAQRMHETEGGYNLCVLKNIRLDLATNLQGSRVVSNASPPPLSGSLHVSRDDGTNHASPAVPNDASPASVLRLSSVYQYNHRQGTLLLPDAACGGTKTPIAIAAIPATARRFPALTQLQMLSVLALLLADRQQAAPQGDEGQQRAGRPAAGGAARRRGTAGQGQGVVPWPWPVDLSPLPTPSPLALALTPPVAPPPQPPSTLPLAASATEVTPVAPPSTAVLSSPSKRKQKSPGAAASPQPGPAPKELSPPASPRPTEQGPMPPGAQQAPAAALNSGRGVGAKRHHTSTPPVESTLDASGHAVAEDALVGGGAGVACMDTWILGVIDDHALRSSYCRRLEGTAQSFSYAHTDLVFKI